MRKRKKHKIHLFNHLGGIWLLTYDIQLSFECREYIGYGLFFIYHGLKRSDLYAVMP